MLESIVEHAMRGCEMLGDLMLVARPPQIELAGVDVSQWFTELVGQASYWAEKYAVQLAHEVEFSGQCRLDPTALREAVWCLLRNAIEAVGQGGEIWVRASRTSDDQLQIEIQDDGPGLSPMALQHCFDPFYCGREAGRGLGVGLTKAKCIVELHHGEIWLENLPAGGCRACVVLPSSPTAQQSPS
jgi:signal transduction histidine kinase